MKTVGAIKSRKHINHMKAFLEAHSTRDYCLFLLGINTGIKLQELLHLKVHEVSSKDGEIVEFLSLPHYNNPPVYLNATLRQNLKNYINHNSMIDTDYLFRSRKTDQPISRQQAYRIINDAAKDAGIEDPVGMTTLRKTFGYHAYYQGVAISLIQKRLQHASPSETIHFIGVNHHSEQIKLNIDL
ncbi:tyrosine-type recombinase/integrase [Mesobacillus subterraneus]|jgi:integrase|uniref:tyrosine-type recombinase/integrase n=1 Tax=Mesobacillus subterraneus TaxID=285983 RepID=UPI00203A3A80|nr:tyrosine-type recombinase/integrase [Mesobacillus subterraneus]MCM3663133.1 tyrosine-type recombinase/integrase [Mesobacillus subterraneus]MCM3682691.1 tyrosine-type recombinase/integrase [Mesobacillus subterraneus]